MNIEEQKRTESAAEAITLIVSVLNTIRRQEGEYTAEEMTEERLETLRKICIRMGDYCETALAEKRNREFTQAVGAMFNIFPGKAKETK